MLQQGEHGVVDEVAGGLVPGHHERHEEQVHEPDHGKWDGLARYELDGRERAHLELLQRAYLALAHDRERCEQQTHLKNERPYYRGNVVVATGEVRVVPGALPEVYRQ